MSKKKSVKQEFIFVNETTCEAYVGMKGGRFIFSPNFADAKIFDDINQVHYLESAIQKPSILIL
jgi:hypothetical protein